MSPTRTALCTAYALIALLALIATWGQNLSYFGSVADFLPALGRFVEDAKVNPAARSITVDIGFFFLAAAVFMVIEARKLGVRYVWAYIAGGLFVAISVTFPLFLIARELKLPDSDARHLKSMGVVLLGAFTAFMLALVAYVGYL